MPVVLAVAGIPYHPCMRTAFGGYLKELLAATSLSQNRFAKEVGVSQALVNQVISGRSTPPWKRMPDWADRLGLEPGSPGRQRFLDLAAIAHLPEEAQARFEGLVEE